MGTNRWRDLLTSLEAKKHSTVQRTGNDWRNTYESVTDIFVGTVQGLDREQQQGKYTMFIRLKAIQSTRCVIGI